jgi:hypothetical protein
MGLFFCIIKAKRQTHPAQWVGLKALGRGLGVGGRKTEKKKAKGVRPAPADLHPPLSKTKVAKE